MSKYDDVPQWGNPRQPLYDYWDKLLDEQEENEEFRRNVDTYVSEVNSYCDYLRKEIKDRDKKIEDLSNKINDLKFENIKLETKLSICFKTTLEDHYKEIHKAIEVIKRDMIE